MTRCRMIAEIGWNHMGDMELARKMIDAARDAGADYAKFQTWSVCNLKPGPWDGDGRREIYEQAELTREKHVILKEHCDNVGIKFLTSCFTESDIDFIASLSKEVKIPGTESYNIPLVTKALQIFDTVFISTGSAKRSEYIRWASYDNAYLMHCVSAYPCPANCVNLPRLREISTLTPRFGYSGHYDGIEDAIAAISMGATVIEKHFTTDKSLPGRDNKFALLPDDFAKISNYVGVFNEMNEDRGVDFQDCEQEPRNIYAGRWQKV